MLKITEMESGHQRTLVLEGKLVDPWVAELEKTWDEARRANQPRRLVVDLKDVTVISQRGENLLFQMMSEGAQFNCCRGVLTKHVLQRLECRREEEGRAKGVRR
jgi:hypothetical protein